MWRLSAAVVLAMTLPGAALAQSGPLTIVTVDAAAALRLRQSCKIETTEALSPSICRTSSAAICRSRECIREPCWGAAGSPAAGKTGYLYRWI